MITLKQAQVPVFSRRCIQRAPIVGDSEIYLYNVMVVPRRHGGETAALDRTTLSVKWRARFGEFGPEEMYDTRLLIARDWQSTGVIDVAQQRLLWNRDGWGLLWRRVLVLETENGLDLVEPSTTIPTACATDSVVVCSPSLST